MFSCQKMIFCLYGVLYRGKIVFSAEKNFPALFEDDFVQNYFTPKILPGNRVLSPSAADSRNRNFVHNPSGTDGRQKIILPGEKNISAKKVKKVYI